MKTLALWAIRLYQRLISPYKGFRCAYAVHTGHASCSGLGYRAIRRFGVLGGVTVLRMRLHKCGVAYRRYRRAPGAALASQAGFCDADCFDGCDICDCAVEMPCDFGSKKSKLKKKQNKQDKDIVLPPQPGAT